MSLLCELFSSGVGILCSNVRERADAIAHLKHNGYYVSNTIQRFIDDPGYDPEYLIIGMYSTNRVDCWAKTARNSFERNRGGIVDFDYALLNDDESHIHVNTLDIMNLL